MNLTILMLPIIVSGVSFGVILNIIMPNILIVSVYTLISIYVCFNLTRKALLLNKKENVKIHSEK
jgi:hypothetical protein